MRIRNIFSSRRIYSVEYLSSDPYTLQVEVQRRFWFNIFPDEYELFDVECMSMHGAPRTAIWDDPLVAELNLSLSRDYHLMRYKGTEFL